MQKPTLDNGLKKRLPKALSKKEYDRLVELQMTPMAQKRRSDGKLPSRVYPDTPTPPTVRYVDDKTKEIENQLGKSVCRNLSEEFEEDEDQVVEKLVEMKRPDQIAEDFRVSLRTACNNIQNLMLDLDSMYDSFIEMSCNKK